MKKRTKFIVYPLLVVFFLAFLLLFLNNFAENKLEKALEDNLTENNFSYEKIDVELLSRKATVKKPTFTLSGKNFTAQYISFNNIAVLEYLTNGNIEIGELVLQDPEFKTIRDQEESQESDDSEFKESILVTKLLIRNGRVSVAESESSSREKMYGELSDLEMNNFRINRQSMENSIPFTYEGYSLHVDSLYLEMDPRHHITTGKVTVENDQAFINDFKIIPRYGKEEFQQHIPHELDRVELHVNEIDLGRLSWEYEDDSLRLENPLTRIKGARLEIYRDKLQPDDERHKKMYSQMLRELPVKLKLDTIRLTNSFIQYQEKVDEDRPIGEVDFKNVHASIYNLSNIDIDSEEFPKTHIDVQCLFMQKANLEVRWVMDISNRNDEFTISGDMDHLSEEAMNRFMKPAMNVESKGAIDDMSFSYSGNHTEATGNMELVYDDFKVEVLRKDGSKKNRILSALANLIIKNDAQSGDEKIEDVEVTRDKTKSFWNYLWKCVREGALKSFL